MKFEIINDKNQVVMWCEQVSCIPPLEELKLMSQSRYRYKCKLNGKNITLKRLKEMMDNKEL
jgi:hypothetical protein